jgi:hypothetical protein
LLNLFVVPSLYLRFAKTRRDRSSAQPPNAETAPQAP